MRAPLLLGLLLAALPGAPLAAADDPKPEKPAPPEPRTESLHGLEVTLYVPKTKPEGGYSLLVYFHGLASDGLTPPKPDAFGKEVGKLVPLVERGFVLAGPSSTAKEGGWKVPDLKAVAAIAKDLIARYEVPRERRHVAGFWTGGEGVPLLAFEEDLGFRTATWIDADWGGGSVAKWAKEELDGLFLWGPNEGPSRIARYRKSCSLLAERIRRSAAHGEDQGPGLGRSRKDFNEFPEKTIPFLDYFLETMEGRFEPGREASFAWADDLAAARAAMAAQKCGGFAYVYSGKPDPDERDRTKEFQRDVLFDRVVRHFAEQLVAVKIERGAAKELLDEAKVTATPAVVVFRKGGKEILRSASGTLDAKTLIPYLRAVAADQELPR